MSGPQVGDELAEQGAPGDADRDDHDPDLHRLRFQWKFAIGAIVATLHDPVITLGVFAILGLTFDLSVLAAMLAIIGYSVNDTIVVFDRIRENFRKIRRGTPEEIMNLSINETTEPDDHDRVYHLSGRHRHADLRWRDAATAR